MAAENQFRLTITAVDKATAVFNRIQGKLGSFGKRLDLSKRLGSLDGKLASLRFDTLSKKAAGFGSTLAKAAEPMNVVVGAATIGGLAAAASNWASLGSNVLKTSQIIGVSTQDLQSLRGAAKLAGVSAEQLDGGLAQLGTTLNDAFYGRNMQALALLNKLGIGIHRTKDGAIDTTRALKDLADALANPKMNAQTKSMLAGQFGLQGLLPMLLGGSKNLAANQGRATQLGAVQSDAELRKAAETEQKKREAALAGQHAENWLGSTISPLYNKIMETATKWLSESPGMTIAGSAAMGVAGTWMAKKALQAVGSKLLNAAAKSAAAAVTETGGAAAAATGAEVTGALGGLGSAIMAWVSRLCAPAYLLLHSDSLNAGENEWVKKRMQDGGLGSKTWHGLDINGREYAALRDKARGAYQPWYEFGDENDLGYMKRYVKEHPGEAPKGWIAQAATPAAPAANGGSSPGTKRLFDRLETQYQLPSGLLDSVWAAESGRGKNMRSQKGALGHFQFMPSTAAQYGLKNPDNLGESADAAGRLLRDLLRQNRGDLPRALAAYNWGQGNLNSKGLANAPTETRNYIAKVSTGMGMAPAALPTAQSTPSPAVQGDSNRQVAALLAQLNDSVAKLGQLKVNVQTHVTGLPAGAAAQSRVVDDSLRYNYPMPQMVTP
ncbi:lytic transglycosylase domain-containing protein [Chromobacterium rhizoryzae]|uniref:lytic transglycosylase domain-containing protein n=1 Tax=Chromobacterium rhizoryzae TaxID=1778675 RepID=UPI001D069130|nr:lytic transglycosylase domain-containing protein [Chromobacterium rhizoryzae]